MKFFVLVDNRAVEVGERKNIGLYCWTCGIKLTRSEDVIVTECPQCSRKYDEPWELSISARERGIDRTTPKPKLGVATAGKFEWRLDTEGLCDLVDPRNKRPIIDETGRRFTMKEFEGIISECPVWNVNGRSLKNPMLEG